MDELDKVVGFVTAFGDDDDDAGDADDLKQAVATSQITEQTTGYRLPMNGDTSKANNAFGRMYEEMVEYMDTDAISAGIVGSCDSWHGLVQMES
ncbi:hypothetical protein PHMEG_0008323 [Phytophthora megakarya]|uniref:Uncharacterized protein n=1 Tax=Phytophthora megakarya TaxID=4795 RepID=A0A225WJG2_9STRA|nr:hypothetical protein PHMEG_0008323 [Phytophthora megakarya]